MKIYLVGGAVRDLLLKKTPEDKDYVIVGATKEDVKHLEDTMFFKVDEKTGEREVTKVGKSFPVYLHPESEDEYALARKERKVSEGYHGFEFEFDETVTLEEDLLRRDLTINSIAMDLDTNEVIDPFNGQEDIKNKVLRPTSDAFKEDPLRCLRAARFSAQLGFSASKELKKVMSEIAKSGELSSLSKERISKESFKAFNSNKPSLFFKLLKETNCLKDTFSFLEEFSKKEFDEFLSVMDKLSRKDKAIILNSLFFFNEEVTTSVFKLSKSDTKFFRIFKNNHKRLVSKLDSPEEALELLRLFGFGRKEALVEFLNSSLGVLFDSKTNNLEFLSKLQEEVDKINFEEQLGGVEGKEVVDRIKELKIQAISKHFGENSND